MNSEVPVLIRSYAQNFEDVRLARIFGSVKAGFYVDVGAAHPRRDSVTKHFYDIGWRGINIEPDVELFQALCRWRPRDINLNIAASSKDGTLELYETGAAEGWSTVSAEAAEFLAREMNAETRPREVEVRTLTSICDEWCETLINFLKIDVESHELAVIEGMDFERWRPQVLIVEATRPHTRKPSHETWEPLLIRSGYLFAAFDDSNRFYVDTQHKSWIEVLSEPIGPYDLWELDRYVSRIEELEEKLTRTKIQLEQTAGRRLMRAVSRFLPRGLTF